MDLKPPTERHLHPYVFELPVWDKLDNVSGNSLAHCWPEDTIVSIQELHSLKVCGAHPHDDDGQRQQGGPNDGVPGLVEVGDLAVRQDEEDKVLLQKTRRQLSWPVGESLCVIFQGGVLTVGVLLWAPLEAMEATWLMMGEKLVGPENFSWGSTIL